MSFKYKHFIGCSVRGPHRRYRFVLHCLAYKSENILRSRVLGQFCERRRVRECGDFIRTREKNLRVCMSMCVNRMGEYMRTNAYKLE